MKARKKLVYTVVINENSHTKENKKKNFSFIAAAASYVYYENYLCIHNIIKWLQNLYIYFNEEIT